MVLSEGWKVREITGDKAGNIIHLEVEEDVNNVLYVHGFLVCPLSPHMMLAGICRGMCESRHSFAPTTSFSS